MRVGSVVLAFAGQELAVPRDVRADTCQGTRVQEAADIPPGWDAPVRRLRQEIASPTSDGGCAAVILSLEPTSKQTVRLAAMTWDGRYAEREVLRPSALVATALGLVASIPDERLEEAPETKHPRADRGAIVPRPLRAADAQSFAEASLTQRPPKLVALSLEGEVGVRFTSSTPLELFDFQGRFDALLRAHWLLSALVRYAPTAGPHPDDTRYDGFVAGVGAGRRMAFGDSVLDLSVVPELGVMMMTWNADQPDGGSGTAAAFRLGLSLRWLTPLRDSWRFTVTADVDAIPADLRRDASLGAGAPALPVWTSGLCVGGSGELL